MATTPINPQFTIEDSSSGTSTPPQFTIEEAPTQQQGLVDKIKSGFKSVDEISQNLGKGFVKGAGDTVRGVGNLIRQGIDTAVLQSPALSGVDPEKIEKLKETLVPQVGQNALETLSKPKGVAQQIGYGGEALTEFILGDEALKGLSLADKLAQTSKAMKLLQKSPKLMRAAQIGAEALRQGAVQGAQTLVKTGGDVGEAAKEGGTMAGISAAIGAPMAVVSGLSSKAGKLGETLETAKSASEQAKKVAKGAEEVAPQTTKALIEAPAEGVVPEHKQIVETAGKAVDAVENAMHQNFDAGVKQISSELSGKTIDLNESPLFKAAKEAQDALKQEPKGLTERLGKSLQGMIPGTERGEKMTGELLGEGKKAAAAEETPSWLKGEEVKGEEAAGAALKEEALTVDNLINYRQRLTKMIPQLAYDDPNKQVIYKLVEGVDNTIQKMADDSGKPEISDLYKNLREDYKKQVQFFNSASAKKAGNQVGYEVAQKLQSGNLNDAPKYLLSGNNSLAKVRAAKDLLGPESVDNLAIQTIRRWAEDAVNPETKQLNVKKLVDQWNKVPPDVRNEFFSKANYSYRQMIEDLSKSPEANKEVLDKLHKLVRFGIFPAVGALTGYESGKMTGSHKAEMFGALAGAVYGGGRSEMARDLIKYMAEHPEVFTTAGKVSKVIESPVSKKIGTVVRQQATQALSDKPNVMGAVYQGAAQPLSEEQ